MKEKRLISACFRHKAPVFVVNGAAFLIPDPCSLLQIPVP
jgi:hypothetical protein